MLTKTWAKTPQNPGIYLDANAGAPLRPIVAHVLNELWTKNDGLIANPSSIHGFGREAKKLVSEAKISVARSLGKKVDTEQLVFTSSGTEANQLGARSVLELGFCEFSSPHWITSPVEHDSLVQLVKWFEKRGGRVSYFPIDSSGTIHTKSLNQLLTPETVLVSQVWVNNETGIVSDILKLQTQLTQQKKTKLLIDAAQAWGKLDVDLYDIGADLVTVSGHKIGGPAGVGCLWIREGTQVLPQILGKQEKGRRGGTENVLGMIGMGVAARSLDPVSWASRVTPVRDRLEKAILTHVEGTQVNGQTCPRIANTLSLNFENVEGDGLVMALDLEGFCVSSGSACSSGALEPSHVLLAMGRSKSEAVSAIRISLVDEVPWEVLERFVLTLGKVVTRMRAKKKQWIQ